MRSVLTVAFVLCICVLSMLCVCSCLCVSCVVPVFARVWVCLRVCMCVCLSCVVFFLLFFILTIIAASSTSPRGIPRHHDGPARVPHRAWPHYASLLVREGVCASISLCVYEFVCMCLCAYARPDAKKQRTSVNASHSLASL